MNIGPMEKKKIQEIIAYRQLLDEKPPHILELAKFDYEHLEAIWKDYSKKATKKLGITKL